MASAFAVEWFQVGDKWELVGTNNTGVDIHDVVPVRVPGGPAGNYPPVMAPNDRHTFRTVSTQPSPGHYDTYYNIGTDRFKCNNDTGEVTPV